jgi:hypothetical protein
MTWKHEGMTQVHVLHFMMTGDYEDIASVLRHLHPMKKSDEGIIEMRDV